MKKQILSIVLTMFIGIAFASAKELKPKKSYANASQQIIQLLTPSSEVGELEKAAIVRVKIKINSNSDININKTGAPSSKAITRKQAIFSSTSVCIEEWFITK